MMYDYHLHSSFSGDCAEEMEKTILMAIKMQGKELCFTDHLDYDYPSNDINFTFDSEGFSRQLKTLQEKYKNQLIIKKGIELGLQKHIVSRCEAFVEKFKPDFVLCSFHVSEKKDLFNGDFYEGKSPLESWQTFYKDMLETLTEFKSYSVVSHLDIPKRYNEDVKDVPLELYQPYVEQVLDLIIKDEKGIEVNMSGLRSGLKETLPNREILELYYSRGGRIVTIGSDAHCKEDIYSHFYETLEVLEAIGFENITIYEKMKAKYLPIDQLIKEKKTNYS